MKDEVNTAIENNQAVIEPLYPQGRGCAINPIFYIIFIPINVGLYFLIQNISPGYIFPKMLLGNVLVFLLIFILLIIVFSIQFRRKKREAEEEIPLESNEGVFVDDKYIIVGDLNKALKPKLTLREHDFSYGPFTHEWKNISNYTNTDEWLFVLLNDGALNAIKIDNLKEKRRMEIVGIFADRIRRAKTSEQAEE